MAGNAILFDTNVLLSATGRARDNHERALRVLNDWPDHGYPLCTSGQILREYLVVATRPPERNGLGLPLAEALANRDRLLARLKFLDENRSVSDRLRRLVESATLAGKKVHDANLVATALAHGVTRILTENVQDFERFADVIEIVDLRRIS